ncbi:methyltransferase domain-containing protein [Streptomyces sp. NPDC020412]|uniref:methyltransferase domain-containing protein n=1 Tax=Streptomyces sp. NPDC020412 TaxID=3365073 RepID=UPI00379E28E5
MSSPERLVEILVNKGAVPVEWRETVGAVPRELFLPETFEAEGRVVSRSRAPAQWQRYAYADLPLTTQYNDGRDAPQGAYLLPTSSSSMPSVMLEMLRLLQAAPGHRVLEAGAGTGYNAAWLAHRLGSENVVSVEVDPVLVQQAVKNCALAGYCPAVVRGDADRGWPDSAPYDRLLATYTVPRIPYAWIEQVPGGRIVAPWGGSFFHASYAVLDVVDGVGRGRFHGFPAFMRTRNGRPHRGFLRDFVHHAELAEETRTTLDPRAVLGDSDALFHIGLALPDAWYVLVDADDGTRESTLWILADDRRSWASVDYVPGRDAYAVEQYGPRRLWETVETAYGDWALRGRPARDRYGITVTPDGRQRIWLDGEDAAVPTADGPTA